MEENRHIFNNLTQVEKIKPKIDNPIIVEDVTYNFSDLIENEWISHFPQYSHRMRSTFVKGAGIVDEHLANINQCLIQLEDELYRVYDKLSDDKKAEVTKFIQARQNEVNTFIQARKDEVATFISDRKTEVADFIKDRKNEVATFISDKQHLIDEFVRARQNEVANFIQSKTNEVSNYINQKEEQITRFIENKDNEIKQRTETLDNYTKNLEGKIEQFNLVIQGGEATEDKLGLIRLSTISEQVQVATVENLKKALITPNFKDTTPVKWSVNLTVQYGSKEKKIVADNLDKNKLDYVFNSSNYSEFANCHKQTETITRADEEVKNVEKVIYLKLKQVTVRWHVESEDGKINKTIEEVVPTQNNSFIYQFDPSKYSELAKYELGGGLDYVSIDGNNEKSENNIYLRLKQEHPSPEPPQPHPESGNPGIDDEPPVPVPEPHPEPENPTGGGTGSHLKQEDKVITQKDVEDRFFNSEEEVKEEMKSLKEKGVSTRYLKVNDKVYVMGIVNKYLITVSGENHDKYRKEVSYKGESFVKHETVNKANGTFAFDETKYPTENLDKRRVEWEDGTVDYLLAQIIPIPKFPGEKQRFSYEFDFYIGKDDILEKEKELIENNFIEELNNFNKKYNIIDYSLTKTETKLFEDATNCIKIINGNLLNNRYFFLLYPVIQEKLDYDREIDA